MYEDKVSNIELLYDKKSGRIFMTPHTSYLSMDGTYKHSLGPCYTKVFDDSQDFIDYLKTDELPPFMKDATITLCPHYYGSGFYRPSFSFEDLKQSSFEDLFPEIRRASDNELGVFHFCVDAARDKYERDMVTVQSLDNKSDLDYVEVDLSETFKKRSASLSNDIGSK